MMSSQNPNARKSVRLKDYDYAQNGLYFITICCYKGICYFEKSHPNSVGADPCVGPDENAHANDHNNPCVGQNLTIQLNDAGKMIEKWYYKLPEKFPHVKCHEMVVMPNHFHCIIQIAGSVRADTRVGPDRASLPTIMQWFKTMSTNEYIRGVKLYNWKPFYKKIWQRNYYEHIIRDKQSYLNITNYIYNNPAKWKFDRFNHNKLK